MSETNRVSATSPVLNIAQTMYTKEFSAYLPNSGNKLKDAYGIALLTVSVSPLTPKTRKSGARTELPVSVC